MSVQHLAIIMDGNGRWSTRQGLPRSEGHKEGAKRVMDMVDACHDLGIRYLTLYAFSTENWKRPAQEVAALMSLLSQTLDQQKAKMLEHGLQLRAIGTLDRLPLTVRQKLKSCIRDTAHGQNGVLTLALNYGSRTEICQAVQKCAEEVKAGKLSPEDITEEYFAGKLQNSDIPEPDLLIRTAGEQRLSNFLLWQLSYAEFYFSPVLWPDFRKENLKQALEEFSHRTRRFGAVLENDPAAKAPSN